MAEPTMLSAEEAATRFRKVMHRLRHVVIKCTDDAAARTTSEALEEIESLAPHCAAQAAEIERLSTLRPIAELTAADGRVLLWAKEEGELRAVCTGEFVEGDDGSEPFTHFTYLPDAAVPR